MKTLYILLFGLLGSSGVMAQGCLPEGITFDTQAQIDSFQINHPNCTEIEGGVSIHGDDITNLDGLSALTSIGEQLVIGSVLSGGNPILTDITGLANLTSIQGDLYMGGNYSLSDLNGLQGLDTINGNLNINYSALLSLSGLDNVTHINGDVFIDWNNELLNLNGLNNLSSIGGSLRIPQNNKLLSLDGLDNLTSIGSDLFIGNYGWLGYAGNLELYDISSLSNLNNIGGGLYILGNDLLSKCNIPSICEYLVSPNDTVEIHQNGAGCSSSQQVIDSCDWSNIGEISQSEILFIYPNPSSTQITIELPTTPQKKTLLTIYNINGQQLITQPIAEPQTVIDVSGLPSGVYFVKVTDDKKVMIGKVVVE